MKGEDKTTLGTAAVGALCFTSGHKAAGLTLLSSALLYKFHTMGAERNKVANLATETKAKLKDNAEQLGLTDQTGSVERLNQTVDNIATGAKITANNLAPVLQAAGPIVKEIKKNVGEMIAGAHCAPYKRHKK